MANINCFKALLWITSAAVLMGRSPLWPSGTSCPYPGTETAEGRSQAADAYLKYYEAANPEEYNDPLVDKDKIRSRIESGEMAVFMYKNVINNQWSLTSTIVGQGGLLLAVEGCPSAWPPEDQDKDQTQTKEPPQATPDSSWACVDANGQVTCTSETGETASAYCNEKPDWCEIAAKQAEIKSTTAQAQAAPSDGDSSPGFQNLASPITPADINGAAAAAAPAGSSFLPSAGQANFDGSKSAAQDITLLASLPNDQRSAGGANSDSKPGTLPDAPDADDKIKKISSKVERAADNERLWMSNPPSQLVKPSEASSMPSKNPLKRLQESMDRFLSCFDDDNAARLSGETALGCLSREIFGW
ncbi:MAG: hypothetical protein HY547_07360 [Elusimicrobia bacterium]|nr:hypothetical protein [Elusimicrobiota bacterium]